MVFNFKYPGKEGNSDEVENFVGEQPFEFRKRIIIGFAIRISAHEMDFSEEAFRFFGIQSIF